MEIDQNYTVSCFNNHMGEWMVEPTWFMKAVSAIKSGLWKVDPMAFSEMRANKPPKLMVASNGVAIIPIFGSISKAVSSHGGTSSVHTRILIRAAVANPDVVSILLHIDSPGGMVAGTDELAEEVRAAGKIKTVHAFIDDLGASAAFWIASATSHISANQMGQIGSIGTVVVIADTSEAAKIQGVKVHVISTGDFKGAFADGVEITDEQLEDLQERIDDLNAHFLSAVAKGRSISMAAVRKLADGRVHIAAKAKDLGLIDAIGTLEKAVIFAGRHPNGKNNKNGMLRFDDETGKIESEINKTYKPAAQIQKRKIKIRMDEISKT